MTPDGVGPIDGFTFNHEFGGFTASEKDGAGPVIFNVCDTAAPFVGAEKLRVVLSTVRVCAWRAPDADKIRIAVRTEYFFKIDL